MEKPRLLRVTTVAVSLQLLLRGQFRFLQLHGFEVLTASAAGPGVDEVKKEGVDHVNISFSRRITPLRDLVCLWQLIRLIRKFRPCIVHTHTPKAGLLGMMAAWFCRVPVRMHTVAGLPFMESSGSKRWLLKLMEKLTYACAQAVYPNSPALHRYITQELKISTSKLKVIGQGSSNGIDSDYFSKSPELDRESQAIRKRYGIRPFEITFSFVGRIVKDKGVVELLEAFIRLGKIHPVRLLVVGSFEESLDPLPSAALELLKNDSRVVVPGFQDDIRPWLMASEVFVLPSYREGFPNVVMQAACLELPAIVSDINGCNEIILSGQNGLVVKPKDSDDLYYAMLKLAENEPLRRELGKRSRESVRSMYDQKVFWGLLLQEYRTKLTANV